MTTGLELAEIVEGGPLDSVGDLLGAEIPTAQLADALQGLGGLGAQLLVRDRDRVRAAGEVSFPGVEEVDQTRETDVRVPDEVPARDGVAIDGMIDERVDHLALVFGLTLGELQEPRHRDVEGVPGQEHDLLVVEDRARRVGVEHFADDAFVGVVAIGGPP